MKLQIIKVMIVTIAALFFSISSSMAGGAVSLKWENAQEVDASSAAPFYAHDGTTLLSAGAT